MIKKESVGKELYIYIFCPIKRKWDLLYKRWLDKNYGMIMDRQPFTANDVDKLNKH
jgi:hypothetical protein